MLKVIIETPATMPTIGVRLRKEIYSVANRLEADFVKVNIARYNKYAEIDLFNGGDCIEWSYPVSVR